jgi:hypothetical protein
MGIRFLSKNEFRGIPFSLIVAASPAKNADGDESGFCLRCGCNIRDTVHKRRRLGKWALETILFSFKFIAHVQLCLRILPADLAIIVEDGFREGVTNRANARLHRPPQYQHGCGAMNVVYLPDLAASRTSPI